MNKKQQTPQTDTVSAIRYSAYSRWFNTSSQVLPTVLFAMILSCNDAIATEADIKMDDVDFSEMSLEQLMDVEVTSVSKRAQKISDAAAAIFVITQEDFRRSGAANIPEALRMVPGLEVAQIDANKWAITARGFNGRFANKLLVLMDGRSVYTPLYSGVFWDVQDTLLEDIDRIEVIRGPGATLWGSNAVNGVINIITKRAEDTQGGLAIAGGGTEQRGFGAFRYGGQIGDDLYYRGFAKYFDVDEAALAEGDHASDGWHQGRMGFRMDWDPTTDDAFSVSGELFKEKYGTTGVTWPILTPPYSVTSNDNGKAAGGFILGKWDHIFPDSSKASAKTYYDKTDRDELGASYNSGAFDVEAQYEFELLENHQTTVGLGYRLNHYTFAGDAVVSLNPDNGTDNLFTGFIQHEIAFLDGEFRVTAGSKFERNDFTGFEIQPSIRGLWAPSEQHSLWGAVSRAVRTPSTAEHDISIVQQTGPGFPLPFAAEVRGNRDLGSEEVTTFELGYRSHPIDPVSVDVAGFYSLYDNLRTSTEKPPFFAPTPPPPHVVIPIELSSDGSAESWGIEVAADWQVQPWWRLRSAYTHLEINVNEHVNQDEEGSYPKNQFSLRSMMNIGENWELDLWPRYVGDLPALNVDDYVTFDARLAWKPIDNLELSIVGQNLLDSRHQEFESEFLDTTSTQVQRGVYGKIRFEF